MQEIKRAVAIEDLSCLGKCALTITLPVLSAAGVETAVLPTALLSAHTGGFGQVARTDLTNEMKAIVAHWQQVQPSFDGICSGYLANSEQVDIVCDFIDEFQGDDTLILVDPAMADNGKMYAGLSADFAAKMLKLCSRAQVIVPNLTEAALMLEKNIEIANCSREEAAEIAKQLAEKTGAAVVLTGLEIEDEKIGTLVHKDGQNSFIFTEKVCGRFHGTGDLFASVLFAGCLKKMPLEKAAETAARFTYECANTTAEKGADRRFGLCFERHLARLATMMAEQ